MSWPREPSVPGWYKYDGGANALVFLLNGRGQWFAIADNGDSTPCDWGYIDQALGVFGLVRMADLGGDSTDSRKGRRNLMQDKPERQSSSQDGPQNVFNQEANGDIGRMVHSTDAIGGKRH